MWCKTYYVAISTYGHMTAASCLAWVEHSWNYTTGINWWGSTQHKCGIVVCIVYNPVLCIVSAYYCLPWLHVQQYISQLLDWAIWLLKTDKQKGWYWWVCIMFYNLSEVSRSWLAFTGQVQVNFHQGLPWQVHCWLQYVADRKVLCFFACLPTCFTKLP